MSVEDLVQRVVWGKAIVDNAQKFLSKVGFHVCVPWGLYQVGFLFRFFFFLVVCSGLNVSLKS